MRPPRRRWAGAAIRLALLGSTLGVALDWMHVATATTAYAEPVLFGLAWWVPLLFAAAAVAMGLARPLAERLTDLMTTGPTARGAATGLALFVLAYLASGLLPLRPPPVAAIIGVLFLCAWGASDGSALGVCLAVATAVIGTSVEVSLTRTGVFRYAQPGLAGVAIWLPALYATGQMGVGALGKWFVDAPG